MDLLDELEAMAQAALVSQDDDDIPESAIARSQKPFGYSAAMAERKITEHRNDPLRFTVSEDHWTEWRLRDTTMNLMNTHAFVPREMRSTNARR
ncbi:hypothetical protein BFJ68_g2469 [Fusarium oxysporum]|uniref:Uncharacterized protein n=1 Tax=Fusarium oxysporum TaxID=5507 RepID=A0A420RVX0_FUSOX|nr:hypothetical protein BFJ71_g10193 [Fusarium oxysporum]RKL21200.1 hypothetical protein BFJ68_g2469 [Fusarium oxysporum]